jgi:hypothetical protein
VVRGRDLEALHAARECSLVARLDEQVDVLALNADVDDPDAFATRGHDGGMADRGVHRAPPHGADDRRHAEHDMEWMARVERGASPMRLACVRTLL